MMSQSYTPSLRVKRKISKDWARNAKLAAKE
jgi:hypothetical protein